MSIWPQINTSGRRIGYARVSTADQKLRMQLDGLHSVNCDEVFSDHGVSGAKASRPGLDKMLSSLCKGDTVVVFKLDRLGRSVLHLADLLIRFEKQGIHFCSLSEGINTTTPGGKLVYHMFSAFAEFQRDIILENTIQGMRAAKKRGSAIGRPRALSVCDVLFANSMITQEAARPKDVAALLGVSRMTLDRSIKRVELEGCH
jgi:DNA invertase Pin-like site-specific DNA recombinase